MTSEDLAEVTMISFVSVVEVFSEMAHNPNKSDRKTVSGYRRMTFIVDCIDFLCFLSH
jgi:hypothetical protein